MKKLLAAVAGTALICSATLAQAITLSINPVSQTVTAGTSTSAALVISGLGDGAAPSLGVFDIDLTFDPSILSFSGATFGDPVLGDQLDLFALGSITSVTSGVGTVNLFELSLDSVSDLDSLQAGSFTLAVLSFDAIGGGISGLGISINALGDSLGDPLGAETQAGSITVQAPIPEPSSLLLMIPGLFVLMGYTKARKRHINGQRIAYVA